MWCLSRSCRLRAFSASSSSALRFLTLSALYAWEAAALLPGWILK